MSKLNPTKNNKVQSYKFILYDFLFCERRIECEYYIRPQNDLTKQGYIYVSDTYI